MLKDKFYDICGYATISFLYFCTVVFGFERIKKVGEKILKRYANK